MAVMSRPSTGNGHAEPWAAEASRPSDPTVAASTFDLILSDFTDRWGRGETPRAEDVLDRLHPVRPSELVELAYREFCLAEAAGLAPSRGAYLARFPDHAEGLERLFDVHDALGPPRLGLGAESVGVNPPPIAPPPEVGDEIGPYRLVRELGRGGFARVFLAEQADLDDRLVVVKVSSRVTSEPRLLARARHPHIIEVLWHGEVEDGSLQVICMPFLGGATLAAVLAERRRRGGRSASGLDLLDDLDRASTAGYPAAPSAGRPARELISGLSFPRAAAWVVARLAEALDHAYSRGVLHGDVKPSNVLLTADGVPVLLDFNLSVGWRPSAADPGPDNGPIPAEAGGTLAYMAPERLRALADPLNAPPPTAADRHRADVYALGVVLLELLTGRAPAAPGGVAGGRPLPLRELASAYASARDAKGGAAHLAPYKPLPSGLRAVLARCLAPDPVDRYRRAGELAEDLDRWRNDRAPAFARDPSPAGPLARWARRRRGVLAAAVTGLAVAAVASTFSWLVSEADRRERAAASYAQVVDGEESGAFLLRRPGREAARPLGNPAEVARRHLERYGVLGQGDWRRRDEFAGLDASQRGELEVWLLEQALRFAYPLARRSDSPSDWGRALHCLERATTASFGPLRAEADALRRRLNLTEPFRASVRPSPPLWMNEYLLGVASELSGGVAGLRDALGHYEAALRRRPWSFWANYRAAAVSFAIAGDAEARSGPPAAVRRGFLAAAERLAVCVGQRPENPVLRCQYAGCLFKAGRFQEAVEQCDKALALAPEHPEAYATRMYLRHRLGQSHHVQKGRDRSDLFNGGGIGIAAPVRDLPAPAGSPLPGWTPSTTPDDSGDGRSHEGLGGVLF